MNPPKNYRGRSWRNRPLARWLIPGLVFLLSMLLLGLCAYLLLRSRAPRTYKVQMLVDLTPSRGFLARRLAVNARPHGLEITLPSNHFPALEAIDLVDIPNEIDMALIPGGFAEREYPNLRQVAMLSQEALHLLVRPELVDGGINKLRGQRINIGAQRTAVAALARDVLAFADLPPLDEKNQPTYTADQTPAEDLETELTRLHSLTGGLRAEALRNLPDAVFLLATPPADLAKSLVREAGYRLMPIPFSEAYCKDRINPAATQNLIIDRSNFATVEIPAFTYSTSPAVPQVACNTIGTRLLLVAFDKTEPEAISRLLETIYAGPMTSLIQPVPLRAQPQFFPLHEGTQRFLRRHEPLLNSDTVSGLAKIAGATGAFVSGIVAFYGFLRLRKLNRFEVYFEEIRQIELIARGLEEDPDSPADPGARRQYLESKLHDLKNRALKEFSDGGMKGEGLMVGIISLINDTRNTLASMDNSTKTI